MASQDEMRGQETAVQTHRPGRIDTSGRMLPVNPRNAVRTQPRLLSSLEIDAINNKLLVAGQTIETTRQTLYETRFVADSAMQELEHERQIRQQCSEAYKVVHLQYGKKAEEADEMAAKCVLLQNELEEGQMTISDYKLAFKNLEECIASEKLQLEDTAKVVEMRTSELQTAMNRIHGLEKEVKNAVSRECLAKKTINELREEGQQLNLALKRFDGLERERGQLDLALQKVHNLEKEREDTAHKHNAKINEMIAREALAEQKITEQRQEIEELVRELQEAAAAATDRLNPAEEKQGKKRVTNSARGRLPKYRKCKDTRKIGDEDRIVVYD